MQSLRDEVSIERFEPARVDDLVELLNDVFADYIIPIKSTKASFLDFQGSVGADLRNIFVALQGDRMVGYVNPVRSGSEAWIGGVGVVPKMRGSGIGKALMHAAERDCRRDGVREIMLEVIEGNTRAQRLYESLGYAAVRKFLSAEGRPAKYEGIGPVPQPASIDDVLRLHERAYRGACFQRRRAEGLHFSAKDSEMYKVDGGFVTMRAVDTNGFIPFLGVVPEKRGTGIGTSLAKFALSKLWSAGAYKVGVYNVNEDLATLRLLDKFDFRVTMKQIEMRKRLA